MEGEEFVERLTSQLHRGPATSAISPAKTLIAVGGGGGVVCGVGGGGGGEFVKRMRSQLHRESATSATSPIKTLIGVGGEGEGRRNLLKQDNYTENKQLLHHH